MFALCSSNRYCSPVIHPCFTRDFTHVHALLLVEVLTQVLSRVLTLPLERLVYVFARVFTCVLLLLKPVL